VIDVAREVADALGGRHPVVALETTLVAHGFPAEEGIEIGIEAERRVRAAGAVPATIGVLEGRVRVGLSEQELRQFTKEARKVGPRDLAASAVQGAVGATTVGGTLAVCRTAGIGFMATGGIGGVHRGERLDISADLGELARTQALVVCSGAKSLLDVPATAELLETLGVPVLGFGTDLLPLFYAVGAGPRVSAQVESAAEAARIARAHWELGRHSALLLARPPDHPLDIAPLVDRAVAEMERLGLKGQELTPALLARLNELSEGRTLEANRELVLGNAALAAEVAVAYARIAA
jgi:pseudouridine-5'-phosphate glycosidase